MKYKHSTLSVQWTLIIHLTFSMRRSFQKRTHNSLFELYSTRAFCHIWFKKQKLCFLIMNRFKIFCPFEYQMLLKISCINAIAIINPLYKKWNYNDNFSIESLSKDFVGGPIRPPAFVGLSGSIPPPVKLSWQTC